MKIGHDEHGYYALTEGGSTTQYFRSRQELEAAIAEENLLCEEQDLEPTLCVPEGSPLEWD